MSLVQTNYVRGVADDKRSASAFLTAADTNSLATLKNDFIDCGVQHIGASMDGAKTRERFGKTSQSVYRIKEGRVTVLAHRLQEQNALADCFDGGLLHVGVFNVKGDSVTKEVNCLLLETERAVELSHRHGIQIFAVPSGGVVAINFLHV